jgi:galactonate dehydratase
VIRNGMVQAPTGPGICTALLPEVATRPDATVRQSGKSLRA